jgi:hypothetical protein
MPSAREVPHDARGQASVELVAVLPALGLSVAVVVQLVLCGWSLWSASVAARAGARAGALGTRPLPAVRRALPPGLRDGLRVTGRDAVEVHVRVPRIIPGLPALQVGAASRLAPPEPS